MDILPVKCSQTQPVTLAEKNVDSTPAVKTSQPEEEIDYFDFT